MTKLERPHNEWMDSQLGVQMPVLDKGFIRVIDYMGDEAAIVQAARVSYGKGTKAASDDKGLLRYLMRHHHTTPFEMCEIKLHVKLPIFVARQWIRHRTANVNEYSARYSILANEFFIPDPAEIQKQSMSNNQGRGGDIPEDISIAMSRTIEHQSAGAYQQYEELLHGWPWFAPEGERLDPNNEWDKDMFFKPHEGNHGMAREMARMVIPTNIYTEWYWKVDVHNLLHFLRLRADPHAQKEIRDYAEVICSIVGAWMPNLWQAFMDYQMEAVTFSRAEVEFIQILVARNTSASRLLISRVDCSERERKELIDKVRLTHEQS